MADRSDKPPNGSGSADSPTPDGFLSDVMGMQSAFWTSRQRNKLLTLAVALVAVVGGTAYMQIRLNAWNGPFYNAFPHGVIGQKTPIMLLNSVGAASPPP